jgi:hypothetical protein
MRKAIITTIVAGFVAATLVQASYAAPTPGIGISSAGTSSLSNEAGSIAAGANSWANPSGNSFIMTPSGAGPGAVFIRPHR